MTQTDRDPSPPPAASKSTIKIQDSTVNQTPVPVESFYGSKSKSKSKSSDPPNLPPRPSKAALNAYNAGSASTTYLPPSTPPPTYDPDYRAPELVPDTDEPPPLEPSGWGSSIDHDPWSYTRAEDAGWAGARTWDTSAWAVSATNKVLIDGRDTEEEARWWDPEIRAQCARPGPGVLPTLLERAVLGEQGATLFNVTARLADAPSSSADAREGSVISSSSRSSSDSLPAPSPTDEEIRTAVPHPHAYYCRESNSWVLLLWKSSSVLPPLSRAFQSACADLPEHEHPRLPSQERRKRVASCVEEKKFGNNKTHHFHKYEGAVDACKLDPPYRRQPWEREERTKHKRRTVTTESLGLDLEDVVDMDKVIQDGDVSMGSLSEEPEAMDEDEDDDEFLVDLWLCCQCSTYVLVGPAMSGVIDVKYIDAFVRDRTENPPAGTDGSTSVFKAWHTLLNIIDRKLKKDEKSVMPLSNPKFTAKVGWTPPIRKIFERLGWKVDTFQKEGLAETQALHPPSISLDTVEGRINRAKLLRARVEIGAWMTEYTMRFKKAGIEWNDPMVTLDSAREAIQMNIGSHPDQMPREPPFSAVFDLPAIREVITMLGLTETSASVEYLSFAYLAQCRCDPAHTPMYFNALWTLVQHQQAFGELPAGELQALILEERARGTPRFADEDVARHLRALGFGEDSGAWLEYDPEGTPDRTVLDAYAYKSRSAWQDPARGDERQRELDEALNVLAQVRGSRVLWEKWRAQTEGGGRMNPAKAYQTLDLSQETDDEMILMVFSMRIEDQPTQADKMRQALQVIAEHRGSDRLLKFTETGVDPGNIVAPPRPDIPRGLNQLGNTCYLNSLLQYFYTIKDLRDAVVPFAHDETKSSLDSKLSEDDLKRHRVGGRLVTRREIMRSKRFVTLLAELFYNMKYADESSITPKVDLAKLALVTSKDEEEDEADRPATDSSNDTDATLVEDAPARHSSPRSPSPSPSVLGKRPREVLRGGSTMDVDSPAEMDKDKEGYVMVSKPASPPAPPQPEAGPSRPLVPAEKDVEMQEPAPEAKPLPARKPTQSDSVMMFGRQHDVSECMDNCMFQIETALLRFDELTSGEDDKTSIVKRLFYGKLRQRLTAVDGGSRASVHEKEDLFSHLPVNVSEEGYDIYDGLSGYFDDIVEFENKKARMEVSLVDLPPLLQIQLQRVQFNRDTLQPYKSQAYLKFEDRLFMDRFLDRADPEKKARSKGIQAELNACRERIHTLTKGKNAPYDSALSNTANFLSKQSAVEFAEVDDEFIAQLSAEEPSIAAELAELRTKAATLKSDLEDVWRGATDMEYELTSVFIHRGSSPSFGHYFFYSRNLPDKPDEWFKYNDSDVTVVGKEEVLKDTTGDTANPYLLVFARKGSGLVHTVDRFFDIPDVPVDA